ncbi:cupin domain-containing protein [Natrinema soli]|uniref:Cupin domain-containing protein n=2 Tax=Natrinema soli TaxID=1930624 RepID=A0ABD5ST57_9EURY
MARNRSQPDESRVITRPGIKMSLLATSDDTDGAWSLIENEANPGQGPAPHWHKEMIEGFYILEGKVDFEIDDEDRRAGPDEFVLVPPRRVHTFTVVSDEPARYLILVSPGGLEEYFKEIQELRAGVDEWPPSDMAPVIEVMERYDTYLPPVE